MWCMRIKGIVWSDDFKKGYRTLVRLNCKQWSCPHCGPLNALAWRAYLLDRFNKTFKHAKWCFFTITAHKNAKKETSVIKNLQSVWKRLYDRLKRRYGPKNIQYVRVFEKGTKNGRFHMHFLMNCGAAYDKWEFVIRTPTDEFRHPECKWLRKACASLGGGWRCHIRRVWEQENHAENVGLVVGYILKYMGKDMVSFEFPKYQRRVQASRKIGSPSRSKESSGTWEHTREVPLSWLVTSPLPMYDLTYAEIVTMASFEGEPYYPPLRFYKEGQRWDDDIL